MKTEWVWRASLGAAVLVTGMVVGLGPVSLASGQEAKKPAAAQPAAKPAETTAAAGKATANNADKAGAWTFGKGEVLAYDIRMTSAEGDAGAAHATIAAALSGRLELTVEEVAAERAVVGVTLADAKGSTAQNPSGWTPKALQTIGEKDAVLGSVHALETSGIAATVGPRGTVLSVDGYASKVAALKLSGGDLDQSHAAVHAPGASDEDLRVLLSTVTEVLSAAPVKPGATWTVNLERVVPGAGTIKEELTFTLKAMGAGNVAEMAITGSMSLHDAVSTDLGKAEVRESQISGDAKFDATAGRLTGLNRSSVLKVAMPPAVGAAAEVVEYRQSIAAVLNTTASKAGATSVVVAQEAMEGDKAGRRCGEAVAEKTAAFDGPDFVKEPGDLEWGWTEGETMRYRISYGNSTKMNGLGENGGFDNSQKVTIDVTLVVTKVGEDKAATAQLSFDRVRMSMTIPMAGESLYDTDDPGNVPPMMTMFAQPIKVLMKKPMTVQVSRGIIKSLSGFAALADQFIAAMPAEMTENPEVIAQMKSQMTDDMLRQALEPFLRILPEKPVKKGETWTVPGSKMGMAGEAAPPVTYFFDDVQEAEGMRCAYVSTRQAGKVQNQGGEGGPQFKFRQNETKGKYIFIIELGKILNAETSTSISYGGDLPGQDEEGFQREYNSTTTSTMKIDLIE